MKAIIFINLILLLSSCGLKRATEQQKQLKIDRTNFDQSIIKNIDRYENIKNFLLNNIDTIIKFRYSKNTHVGVSGKSDSIWLADDDCYTFFQGHSRYDITNVPDYLKQEFDSLFHLFNENDIYLLEVCKDRKISIGVRGECDESGLCITQELIWNGKIAKDYSYEDNKDTLINENWIYRIGLSEDVGF